MQYTTVSPIDSPISYTTENMARTGKHASQHWTERCILWRESVNCIERVLKIIDVLTRLIYEPSGE